MIVRTALKPHVFLNAIAARINGSAEAQFDAAEYATMRDEQRPVIYLAGGYWRALATWSETSGELVGVSLFNPDRTPEEAREVEKGIAILARLEYRS